MIDDDAFDRAVAQVAVEHPQPATTPGRQEWWRKHRGKVRACYEQIIAEDR